MKPLYVDDYWDVEIKWTRPRPYVEVRENGCYHDESAYLYLITAKYSKNKSKCIYVGKTFDQCVSKRLNQADHQKRYAAFIKNYPRHKFFVSHGLVTINNGKIIRSRIKDVENILIYSNDPEHCHNVQNFYNHGVKGSYLIKNFGYKSSLPQIISLGVFVKN